jgi:nucleoside phosphorylase
MTLPTVVFITALPCEFKAVADYLTSPQEEQHRQGTIYHLGEYPAENPRWRVAVAEAGQTNSVAALETERAVTHFEPEYVFFVGIAGGIKDVALGDVVVAETVKDYERGKVTDNGVLPRGEVGKSNYQLVERAKAVSHNSDWRSKIKRETTVVKKTKRFWFWNTDSGSKAEKQPKVLVPATIATGAKVVGSTTSEIYKFITRNYSEAVAVEMEGIGFLEAVRRNEKVHGIEIRGISDKLAKNAAHDKQWQPIAAENAAAFAFAMLDKLTASPTVVSPNSEQLPQQNISQQVGQDGVGVVNQGSGNVTIGKGR